MKQGNSESDQTPDFVCFRKVVYSKGPPPEFCMFSKKIGFSRETNRIFEKSRIFKKKIRDFVFPAMSHTFFCLKNSLFFMDFFMAQSFQVAPEYVDEITFTTNVSNIEYRTKFRYR